MEVTATPFVQFPSYVIGNIMGTPLSKSDPLARTAPLIVRSIGFTLDMTAKSEEALMVLQIPRRIPAGARIAQSLLAH